MNIMDISTLLASMPLWAKMAGLIILAAPYFFSYMQSRESTKQKKVAAAAQKVASDATERLEAVENQQKKTESEAANTKAQLDILRDTVAGNFENQKTWQQVMNNVSDRRREDNKELAQSLNRLSTASENLNEMIEIQSEHLGRLDKTVQGVEIKVTGAVTSLEQSAQSIRGDYQNMLVNSVNHQTSTEKTLRDLYTAINGLRNDVTTIISQREDVRNKTLQGIEAKFQSIEASISALIAPRPVLLGTPDSAPLPTPETWHEDTETTANIPLNTRDDESDNPLLDSA